LSLEGAGAGATAHVLVVATPSPWRSGLVEVLEQAWYLVEPVDDGASIVEQRGVPRADLAIVDLGLREPSGLTVCATVRARSSIILLAVATDPSEEVVIDACNAGADGVLSAASSPRILLARVRGLLRRIPVRATVSEDVSVGALTADIDTGELTVHGQPLVLRPAEHELLSTLVHSHGKVVSRAELLSRLTVVDLRDADLDGALRRLREVLALHRCGCTIETVRKVGVRLVAIAGEVTEAVSISPRPTVWA
jgi:DNA-binding response OmpR family regulator